LILAIFTFIVILPIGILYSVGKKVFISITNASNEFNINISTLSGHLHNRSKSAGKHPVTGEPLRWMYYEDYIKTPEGIKYLEEHGQNQCIETNQVSNF
jgi:hypothetical protein